MRLFQNGIRSYYDCVCVTDLHIIKSIILTLVSSIDNSEFMRNGDYTPTRFEAQVDAVGLLFSAKTQSNPENTVGLMSMGGKGYAIYFFQSVIGYF